jgi:hemerythrin superfamily protein
VPRTENCGLTGLPTGNAELRRQDARRPLPTLPKVQGDQHETSSAGKDAIALLKADHRQVEGWFSQFEKAKKPERKKDLAERICGALKAHTKIEEEIFYPAFLAATQETELHHEAEVEHAGAKRLIAEIEGMGPDNDYYDAKVTVLSEMIKHHVKEEEQPGGMFAKARKSDMDLADLGERMAARKKELEGEGSDGRPARVRSLLDS